MNFNGYDPGDFYDELFESLDTPRSFARHLVDRINKMPDGELEQRQQAAEASLYNMGITFTVYGDDKGREKIFPFDVVPRIMVGAEWDVIERGLKQRIHALNLFIGDIYGDQKILSDGVVPKELILGCAAYRKPCVGLKPPRDIWCHISGTDLIRDRDGTVYVLEDNLRCPSGVSYVLENRRLLKRTLPLAFAQSHVRAVDDYPNRLLEILSYLAPESIGEPNVVVLSPGSYNSAYFEHAFLAQQMGVELVEGSDLVISDGFVHMRTTKGLSRVDVIYRRIDDDFIDPREFRPSSLLGVPGIMEAYRTGRVALANAPGTGIADDKAVYAYVPEIIKYYLDEDSLLPNVPTYVCWKEKDLNYVVENIKKLVVKPVNESGGYGMIVGPHASSKEREEFVKLVKANPRNYIAQPTLSLSRVPVIVGDHFEGRHADLRPYILCGEEIHVIPGGLTRVAMTPGSLVVNSSQGGGSKDTWIVDRTDG